MVVSPKLLSESTLNLIGTYLVVFTIIQNSVGPSEHYFSFQLFKDFS